MRQAEALQGGEEGGGIHGRRHQWMMMWLAMDLLMAINGYQWLMVVVMMMMMILNGYMDGLALEIGDSCLHLCKYYWENDD